MIHKWSEIKTFILKFKIKRGFNLQICQMHVPHRWISNHIKFLREKYLKANKIDLFKMVCIKTLLKSSKSKNIEIVFWLIKVKIYYNLKIYLMNWK
jgi:hypothetical protein